MAGAVFTKIGIGVGFFLLIFMFGIGFFVYMGNEYGVGLEPEYTNQFSGITDEYLNINYDSAEIVEGGGIDARTSDIAQIQGGISAAKQQLNYFDVIKNGLSGLVNIFAYDPVINVILYAILTVMLIAGLLYVLIGRLP
jgi:hypothetical protein